MPRWTQNKSLNGFFLPMLLLLLTAIGCGGGGGDGADASISAQTIQTTIGEFNVGSVISIPLSTGSTSVSFSDLKGQEQFILSVNSASKTAGTFNAQISGSFSQGGLSQNFVQSKQGLPSFLGEVVTPEDPTAAFHDYLREVEETLPSLEPIQEGDAVISAHTLRASLQAGERGTLKILNSLSSTESYSTITVEVKMVTPHFVVYKDVEAGELGDEDIKNLIGAFEPKADLEYATFGPVSDIDQNGKVNIVFSPALNRMGGSGGIVTGFFFAGDLQPTHIFPASNGGEFIYCHVPDESGRFGVPVPKAFYLSNTGPLCFPHELQHAINYNMRVLVHQGNAEPSPFNEGQSHFAEDIYSDYAQAGPENPSRVNIYFNSQMPSFTAGISLAHRGGSYLFYRYLYEQAQIGRFPNAQNGGDLLRKIHDTNKVGLESIEEATGFPISTLVSDFFSSLPLSGTGLSTDLRYNLRGLSLRGPQEDGRNTILNGPPVTPGNLPHILSVPAMSGQYLLLTGSALLGGGSTLNLQVDLAGDPVATLIRIEDL